MKVFLNLLIITTFNFGSKATISAFMGSAPVLSFAVILDPTGYTPPRTPRISGLKSQILKPPFLG